MEKMVMQDIILEIINQFGYIGIFLLITIENIFPPIPSEIILCFGGFMTTFSDMNIWGVILSATLGSVTGAVILYIIGRVLTINRLDRLIDSKIGRVLRLKKEDARRAGQWFESHGNIAVLLCRFVPIMRSIISVPAGISKMKFSLFLTLTILGTFIWNTVLVYLGNLAGSSWDKVVSYVDFYSMVVVALVGIFVLIFGVVFIKKRFLN
jgi:membrane protein DedA with SNARE-associated domain